MLNGDECMRLCLIFDKFFCYLFRFRRGEELVCLNYILLFDKILCLNPAIGEIVAHLLEGQQLKILIDGQDEGVDNCVLVFGEV